MLGSETCSGVHFCTTCVHAVERGEECIMRHHHFTPYFFVRAQWWECWDILDDGLR